MAAQALTILIPLHDEAEGVPALAAAMRTFATRSRRPVEFVFVDDGSTDGTAALLAHHCRDLPGTVERHPDNRGLTAALTTGLNVATGELIAWLDADLTYDPEILHALADAVEDDADVGIASCYHPDGLVEGVAGWRLALSGMASRIYRRITRAPIHTFTCMVRVYRREVLASCRPTTTGFLGVTEVLLLALRAGYRVVELPATLRRREVGQSKMRVLRVGLGHLRLMWASATGAAAAARGRS